jgi:hypothetical protein
MPWWRTLWTSDCHSPTVPMTHNPFGVSSFSHTPKVLSAFAKKGSRRLAQGTFVLDGTLALAFSLVSSLCFSTRRIVYSFTAYRSSNVTIPIPLSNITTTSTYQRSDITFCFYLSLCFPSARTLQFAHTGAVFKH